MPRGGNTTQRGYGADHQGERKRYAKLQAAGVTLTCRRCGGAIHPGQAWDLGHHDHDRTLPARPEHRHRTLHCVGNRSAGASKGNRQRGRRRVTKVIVLRPATAKRW
jgi:hypothetical protein